MVNSGWRVWANPKAKTIIKRVIIGMVIVGMAYGIVTFVLGSFIPAGQQDNPEAKTAEETK